MQIIKFSYDINSTIFRYYDITILTVNSYSVEMCMKIIHLAKKNRTYVIIRKEVYFSHFTRDYN